MTVPAHTDDDLTRVPGIDSRIADQLRAAGFRSVDQLARATVDQVVAACGGRVATSARAQEWIAQAAELAGQIAPTPDADADGETQLLPRRTFTVEVGLDSSAAQVVATRVVHLETQEAGAWASWSRARLLDFLEARIGVADAEHRPLAVEAAAGQAPAPAPLGGSDRIAGTPSPAAVVHRFGLVKAATYVMGRGEATARLRLDPADLDLPPDRPALAQVELLARPAGAGRAEVLDARTIDLTAGRALEAVLRGQLPDRDPPFAVFAVVRILVDQPSGPPKDDLGSAALELVPGDGPAA